MGSATFRRSLQLSHRLLLLPRECVRRIGFCLWRRASHSEFLSSSRCQWSPLRWNTSACGENGNAMWMRTKLGGEQEWRLVCGRARWSDMTRDRSQNRRISLNGSRRDCTHQGTIHRESIHHTGSIHHQRARRRITIAKRPLYRALETIPPLWSCWSIYIVKETLIHYCVVTPL